MTELAFMHATAVTLQANNGHLLTSNEDRDKTVLANRTQRGPWEVFRIEVVDEANRLVALLASNGQYLSASGSDTDRGGKP